MPFSAVQVLTTRIKSLLSKMRILNYKYGRLCDHYIRLVWEWLCYRAM